jgi:hypothetical protein
MSRERAGLARAMLIFLVGLAAAALLIAVLNDPFNELAATSASMAETEQVAQGREWITMFWDGLPVIIVFLAFLQLLAAAAAERRLPGQ